MIDKQVFIQVGAQIRGNVWVPAWDAVEAQMVDIPVAEQIKYTVYVQVKEEFSEYIGDTLRIQHP